MQVNYNSQKPIYSQSKPINSYNVFADKVSNYSQNYTDSYYSEYNETNENDVAKTAGMAAILQAIALGLEKGSKVLSTKLAAGKEFTSHENIVKIASNMLNKNKLDVSVGFINEANKSYFTSKYGNFKDFDIVAKGQNAFFSDELKLAVAPQSKPSLILHELGHAINEKKALTRILQKSRRYAGYAPTILLLADRITKDRNNGKKSIIEKHAGLLGFSAFVPTIIEEGLASYRGIKAAKSVLGNAANISILRKNYAIALGTYILAGIGLGIAAKQTIVEDKLTNR